MHHYISVRAHGWTHMQVLCRLKRLEQLRVGIDDLRRALAQSTIVELKNSHIRSARDFGLDGQICYQVHHYLSADNLRRDHHLRSYMCARGWIDMQVLLGFMRLKQLCVSVDDLRRALARSKHVELKDSYIRSPPHLWLEWLPASDVHWWEVRRHSPSYSQGGRLPSPSYSQGGRLPSPTDSPPRFQLIDELLRHGGPDGPLFIVIPLLTFVEVKLVCRVATALKQLLAKCLPARVLGEGGGGGSGGGGGGGAGGGGEGGGEGGGGEGAGAGGGGEGAGGGGPYWLCDVSLLPPRWQGPSYGGAWAFVPGSYNAFMYGLAPAKAWFLPGKLQWLIGSLANAAPLVTTYRVRVSAMCSKHPPPELPHIQVGFADREGMHGFGFNVTHDFPGSHSGPYDGQNLIVNPYTRPGLAVDSRTLYRSGPKIQCLFPDEKYEQLGFPFYDMWHGEALRATNAAPDVEIQQETNPKNVVNVVLDWTWDPTTGEFHLLRHSWDRQRDRPVTEWFAYLQWSTDLDWYTTTQLRPLVHVYKGGPWEVTVRIEPREGPEVCLFRRIVKALCLIRRVVNALGYRGL